MADKRPITTQGDLAELTNTDSLIAGASAVLSEQASSPSTPASGYGVVYAKTDGKLYFKNDAGTETDLTATGAGTDPVIREYTSNDTWTTPTAANFWGALVVCVGAGGGGGSGRRHATSVTRGAGAGGSGGAYVVRLIRAATLSLSSYSITVGAGGTGGAAATTDNTNGVAGLPGGVTTFGSLVSSRYGNGGTAGTNLSSAGAVAGGQLSNCTPAYGPFAVTGGQSGAGNAGSAGGNGGTGLILTGAAGGGGGGGIDGLNTVRNGGNGGAIFDAGIASAAPAGGTTTGTRNGTSGTDIANNILFDIDNSTTAAMGTGGGGGASGDTAGTIAGGNGGNGGKGAGGGGGGASTNGANSGAGGNGGGGLCFVVEYYGA